MHAFHYPKPVVPVARPASSPPRSPSKVFHFLCTLFAAVVAGVLAVGTSCLSCAEHLLLHFFPPDRERSPPIFSANDEDGGEQEVDLEAGRGEPSAESGVALRNFALDSQNRDAGRATRGERPPLALNNIATSRGAAAPEIGVGKTTAGVSVDANQVLRGEGLALANVPMEQDRVYFEVHVVEPGRLLVGAARGTAGDSASWSGADYDDLLSQQPPSSRSFVEFGGPDGVAVEKDDVISCAFDQSDFPTSFEVFLNGAPLRDQTLTGLRGEVWPALVLRDGAEAQFVVDPLRCCHWTTFKSRGFNALAVSRSLIG